MEETRKTEQVLKAGSQELMPLIAELVQMGREVRLTVTGNSMYPLLRSGMDSVVLRLADSVRRGDVPLYRREDGSYVLHRVIRVEDGVMTMMGDNQTEEETPVYSEQVVAIAKGFYRGKRYIAENSASYRLYAWLWTRLVCLRPFMLAAAVCFRRIGQAFKRGKYRETA